MSPTPGDVSGDLHKTAEIAAWEALGHGAGLVDSIQMMTIVGTVLQVAHEAVSCQLPDVPTVLMPDGEHIALDDPRVLGEPTCDEMHIEMVGTFEEDVSALLASRRARLFRSMAIEERFIICRKPGCGLAIYDDSGDQRGPDFITDEDAETFRLGLIARRKSD